MSFLKKEVTQYYNRIKSNDLKIEYKELPKHTLQTYLTNPFLFLRYAYSTWGRQPGCG